MRVRRLEPNPWEPMKKSSKGKSCFPSLVQGPKVGRAAPGKSGLHARGEGERVLALE